VSLRRSAPHVSYVCLTLTFVVSVRTHSYAGLASFYIGRELEDSVLITRGTECKDEIEKLVVSASTWNFQNSECQSLHAVIFLSVPLNMHLILCSLIFTMRPQRLIFFKPKNSSVRGTLMWQKDYMMLQY